MTLSPFENELGNALRRTTTKGRGSIPSIARSAAAASSLSRPCASATFSRRLAHRPQLRVLGANQGAAEFVRPTALRIMGIADEKRGWALTGCERRSPLKGKAAEVVAGCLSLFRLRRGFSFNAWRTEQLFS
jgi:hypothetical protein